MLSKCLNPHCSAVFHYLGQGRLFRIDFNEAWRRGARSRQQMVTPIRAKTYPVENFWLCDVCAAAMTIELSDAGEVRLVPLGPAPGSVPAPQTHEGCAATAS